MMIKRETYKEYRIDSSESRKVSVYSYSDLEVKDAATAANIIRGLYNRGQIELVEYGGFLALDEDGFVMGYAMVSKGGIVQTTFDPQVIYKNLEVSGAKKVIFFHNHPSGNLIPSSADINVTFVSSSILTAMGIEYVDHVIVSPLGYYSFAEDKTYEGFKLTRYAAAGVKLKEATVEAYVPELRLYVEKSNVTEAFYKANRPISGVKGLTSYVEGFLDREGLEKEPCMGFVAINNALYPDFISAEVPDGPIKGTDPFDPSSDQFFLKFSRTMMSACTIHMAMFINKEIKGDEALSPKWADFFVRLGALGSMVNLNVMDILVRDTKTGMSTSIIDEVRDRLNSVSIGGEDQIKSLEKAFKFIKI